MEVCGRQRGDGRNEPTPNTDCKGSIPLLKVLCSCILNDFVDNQVEGPPPPPPPPPKQFPLPGLLSSSKCRRINLVPNKWHTIVIRLTVAFASMCMSEVSLFHCVGSAEQFRESCIREVKINCKLLSSPPTYFRLIV